MNVALVQTTPGRNPGIVPPWLTTPAPQATMTPRNPGIIPPWLDDDAHICAAAAATEFVREPIRTTPLDAIAAALRAAR